MFVISEMGAQTCVLCHEEESIGIRLESIKIGKEAIPRKESKLFVRQETPGIEKIRTANMMIMKHRLHR